MKAKTLPLVIVEWGDAWGSNTWEQHKAIDTDDNVKPAIVQTVGWLMRSNKEGVLLTPSLTPFGGSPLNQFIPKGMIRKLTKVGAKHNVSIDRS